MEELFEQIIYQAIKKNVSDIHLQCTEKGVIKFRICGELLTYETYEKTNIIQLMNYIRFISKIDLNYYRKPQTGHYVYVLNNKKYNLRISSLIGKDMDSIVIRILNNHQKLSLIYLVILLHIMKIMIYFKDIPLQLVKSQHQRHVDLIKYKIKNKYWAYYRNRPYPVIRKTF